MDAITSAQETKREKWLRRQMDRVMCFHFVCIVRADCNKIDFVKTRPENKKRSLISHKNVVEDQADQTIILSPHCSVSFSASPFLYSLVRCSFHSKYTRNLNHTFHLYLTHLSFVYVTIE